MRNNAYLTRIPHPRFVAFLAVFGALICVLVRWLPFDVALVHSFDVAAIAFLLSCVICQ